MNTEFITYDSLIWRINKIGDDGGDVGDVGDVGG